MRSPIIFSFLIFNPCSEIEGVVVRPNLDSRVWTHFLNGEITCAATYASIRVPQYSYQLGEADMDGLHLSFAFHSCLTCFARQAA